MAPGDITIAGPYTTPALLRAGMESGQTQASDKFNVVHGVGNQQYWAIITEGAP